MSKAKVAITLDETLLSNLDMLVREHVFANRSQAISEALKEKLGKLSKSRLERECMKLDPSEERETAELGLAGELDAWPEY